MPLRYLQREDVLVLTAKVNAKGKFEMTVKGIEWKLFATLWLVYMLFISPFPQSLASSPLDGGISLIDHGTFELVHYHAMDVAEVDGKYYSGYAPGGTVAAAAVYLGFKPFLGPMVQTHKMIALNLLCTALFTAPLSALLCVVFFRVVRAMGAREKDGVLLSLLLGLGTMVFSYACGFFKNIPATLLLFTAFAVLFREKMSGWSHPRRGFLVGLLIGLGVLFDYPVVLIGVILGCYVLMHRGFRYVPWILAGGLLPAVLLVSYQWSIFGSPLATSYGSRTAPEGNVMGPPDILNFFSFLVGLEDGFFLYTPIACLALLGIVISLRRGLFRAETIMICLIVLSVGLLYSGWVYGDREYSHPSDLGLPTRYLYSLCPFIMLPCAWIIGRVRRGWWITLGGLSIFLNYLAAQTGFIPHGVWPLGYSIKVCVSHFGMGSFFAEFLPRFFRVTTFHSYLARSDISFSNLLMPGNRSMLFHLILNQLPFLAVFLLAATAVAFVVRHLWKNLNYQS